MSSEHQQLPGAARVPLLIPGTFGDQPAAAVRRREFNFKNEILIDHRAAIDFLFIGDSITHYWDLQTYFGHSGSLIVNRGISGDKSDYVRQRFEGDVVQLAPRHVVIKVGINNFKALDDWDAGAGEGAMETITEQIAGDIRAMLVLAQEHGIIPVVGSILPTNRPVYKHDDRRNEGVLIANRKIAKLAEEYGIIYVDYHSEMTAADGMRLREGLSDDGVHPHVRGYDMMAQVLRDTLGKHSIQL